MFGFNGLRPAELIIVFDRPVAGRFVVRTSSHFTAHLKPAAQRLHLFRAGFPHHARPAPRITKRIDQRLDDFAAIAVVPLWNKGVLDCAAQRESFDTLRCPVGGDFFAAHAPDFFGVALEERFEEPPAELIAYPIFEIPRVPHRKQARF